MRPDGNCRACMVEIKGERVLAPSCCRKPTAGHGSDHRQRRARVHSQKMVLELLLSDMPERVYKPDAELDALGAASSASASRASRARAQPAADLSHPAMAVNLDACIQCTRCVRACREEQVNDVIGYAFRGEHSKIVFDLDDPMGDSTCVACGECVQACPTGALMPARDAVPACRRQDRSTRSARTAASAASSPTTSRTTRSSASTAATARPTTSACASRAASASTTSHHPQRLTKPLIRKPGVPKTADFTVDPANPLDGVPRSDVGRSARARRRSAARRSATRTGRSALAGFGSAKGSQRGGVPVPEAGAHRLRHRTTSTTARGCATRRASRRCSRASAPARCRTRSWTCCKAEVCFLIGANPTVEPSGRGDLDQERGQARHQADPRRPAPHRPRAPRLALPAVQARHRRGAAERDDAHDHRRGPGRRGVRRRPHQRLRGAEGERRRTTARKRWRRSAASRPRRSARSRALTPPRRAR